MKTKILHSVRQQNVGPRGMTKYFSSLNFTPIGIPARSKGELYESLSLFLKLGRILGLLPISGMWNKAGSLERLEFRWNSFATFSSLLMLAALTTNTAFGFIGLFSGIFSSKTAKRNAIDWAFIARGPIFYLTVLFIYIFFLVNAKKLLLLLSSWKKISSKLQLQQCDIGLSKSVGLYIILIYTTTLLEYILANVNDFPVFRSPNDVIWNKTNSDLEYYYNRAHHAWAYHAKFHPAFAVSLFIANFVAILTWNYSDLFIIILSRALYFKFKVLVQETENHLMVTSAKEKCLYKLDGITWLEIRKDHLIICELVEEFGAFLSPLIFLSYSVNIYFICLLLNQGLTPNPSGTFTTSLASLGAFFHLVCRLLMVSLVASKINEHGHRISVPIQKCSSWDYCKEVERLERMLGTVTLGLNGMGCFVITRAFILVVVSVIFTIEVVLLQASVSASGSSAKDHIPSCNEIR